MTANFRIIPRNFHDEATVATQYAPVGGYAISNSQNTIRSRVWRSTDNFDQYIVGSYDDGLLRTASFFGMFLHRCHGGNIRLQLYSDATWTSQVYDSGTVAVINVTPSDGFNWGIDPFGTGSIDPFLPYAPFWLWFTPTAHKSYKITLSGNSTVFGYAYWQICRLFLGSYIEFAINAEYGAAIGWTDNTDRARSRSGSLRTNSGATWRTMTFDLRTINENERAGWLDIMRYCGTGKDFVLSWFPEQVNRLERDHLINGKFSSLDALTRQVSYLTKRVQLEEV